jgi:hypothetical protein
MRAGNFSLFAVLNTAPLLPSLVRSAGVASKIRFAATNAAEHLPNDALCVQTARRRAQ